MKIELEVEVTRIERVVFDYNPEDKTMLGTAQGMDLQGRPVPSVPMPVSQFMRLITFYTHKPKNLALGEKVALLRWRVLPEDVKP